MKKILSDSLCKYIEEHSDPHEPTLTSIYEFAKAHDLNHGMISDPLQGNLLTLLVAASKPRLALELGTFLGYSALCIAKALPKDAKLISVERNPKHYEYAAQLIAGSVHKAKIQLVLGEAMDVIAKISDPINFAFIDADKKNNLAYYEEIIPKMPSGGMIVIDNVLNRGQVVMSEPTQRTLMCQAMNKRIAQDERTYKVIVPWRDGLFLVVKR